MKCTATWADSSLLISFWVSAVPLRETPRASVDVFGRTSIWAVLGSSL